MNNEFYKYRNGNAVIFINRKDGTKAVFCEDRIRKPDFAESIDITITTKCSQMCPYCYLGCTPDGEDADISKYEFLNHLHPYTEMAINGNDLDAPCLVPLLQKLKDQLVFANITVNQNQFMAHADLLHTWEDQGLIHGIGISYLKPDDDFTETLRQFPNTVIHVINGLVTRDDFSFLSRTHPKLLILGYKTTGRGQSWKEAHEQMLDANMAYLKENIMSFASWFPVISLDNKAAEQLFMKDQLPEHVWNSAYQGDDGTITFYIDLVHGKYAETSMSTELYDINDKSVDDMFRDIQSRKAARKAQH